MEQATSLSSRWLVPDSWQSRLSGFLLLAAGIVIFAVASFSFGRSSDLSKLTEAAVASALADSRVIDALGSPVKASGSPGGRLTKTEASLIAAVRGSKGSGTLTAKGARAGDDWTLHEVIVSTEGGKRLIVVIGDLLPPHQSP